MNEAFKINSDLAKKSLISGLVILLLTGLLMLYKSTAGYSKVTFYKNVSGCSVSTSAHRYYTSGRHHKRRVRYTVSVVNDEEGINFTHSYVTAKYYDGFSTYNGRNDVVISFFKDENGYVFPVYHVNCDAKEAEREYRQMIKPEGWYWLYRIGFGISILLISMGLKADRVASRYKEAPPVRAASAFPGAAPRPAAPRSSSTTGTDKPLSSSERDELLREFDELTSSGRFDDKLR